MKPSAAPSPFDRMGVMTKHDHFMHRLIVVLGVFYFTVIPIVALCEWFN